MSKPEKQFELINAARRASSAGTYLSLPPRWRKRILVPRFLCTDAGIIAGVRGQRQRGLERSGEIRTPRFFAKRAGHGSGPLPTYLPTSPYHPSTFDDIPIYSQLLAGTLYDQIPSRKTLFSPYPISFPFREEEEDGSREWRSGRAYVPDFWSRSMIFPKRTNEGGGLRMAAMELDLAGGSRVARSRVSIESAAEEACANTAHKWVLTLSDIAM
ncbi:hypothetical protein ALC56_12591 [Trachymyrmex septentrionalis]|uniref:Uncharacterized protein n=1 Tax=Trachymyrmex septentrionalis TaxID=34720 RepID=A0A195EXV2_9HYME|nr:hypothetical protein ALC56_12591 [Trachymyrmex septentrionalis]